jgi:glycosyltransferase involved in cell wall biosynthesis
MLISVVTYTHNRSGFLIHLLDSISSQSLDWKEYEVVVVDNHSTDQTRSVVEHYSKSHPQIRYIYEEKLGTSTARNRGWQEATGEYIGFVDDDGEVSSEWLRNASILIQEMAPEVFGGPVYPFYMNTNPSWFKDEYAATIQGELARPLQENEYLSGSNLFIKRTLLERLNGFDEFLGPHGKQFGYGEETDFVRRVRKEVPEAVIYYDPRIFNYHLWRPEKFGMFWQVRSRFALGRGNYLALSDGIDSFGLKHFLGLLGVPLVIIYELTLGVLLRDRHRFPYPQNYYFEQVLMRISQLGKLYERLRLSLGLTR